MLNNNKFHRAILVYDIKNDIKTFNYRLHFLLWCNTYRNVHKYLKFQTERHFFF